MFSKPSSDLSIPKFAGPGKSLKVNSHVYHIGQCHVALASIYILNYMFAKYIDYKIMSNSICMIYYLAIKYNLYGTMNNYNIYL